MKFKKTKIEKLFLITMIYFQITEECLEDHFVLMNLKTLVLIFKLNKVIFLKI